MLAWTARNGSKRVEFQSAKGVFPRVMLSPAVTIQTLTKTPPIPMPRGGFDFYPPFRGESD
jgi:hypothetical protein